jgi:hypothetical protein
MIMSESRSSSINPFHPFPTTFTHLLRQTLVRPNRNNAPSGIVDDLPNNTPNVTVLLGEVQVPQLGRVLVEVGVGSEDTPGLSLGSDDSL